MLHDANAYLTRVYSQPQNGQVLLIVVLVMVVALTIGLSVVTRSITNLQITTEEENSQRALSAAEAGVERALSSSELGEIVAGDDQIDLQNNSKISNVKVSEVGGQDGFLVNNGNPIRKDDGADIWLSRYSTIPTERYSDPKFSGTVSVFWGTSNDTCEDQDPSAAALEIILISGSKASPVVTHYPVDPCQGIARQSANNFCTTTSPQDGICPQVRDLEGQPTQIKGKEFRFATDIPVTSGLLMRIVPVYAQTLLAVQGFDAGGNNTNLPPQGSFIESVGQSGSTSRKITVYRSYPRVPIEFFPYILFSP